jgi:hypothetical protein
VRPFALVVTRRSDASANGLHLARVFTVTRVLVALAGREVVAALIAGGFRIARRERGRVLLVRDCDAVVVPENAILDADRLAALLKRAQVSEEEMLSWISVAEGELGSRLPTPIVRSGFHRRIRPEVMRPLDAVVRGAKAACARADAAHSDARDVLAVSRKVLAEVQTARPGDDSRLRAVQVALDQWQAGLREVEEEAERWRRRAQKK